MQSDRLPLTLSARLATAWRAINDYWRRLAPREQRLVTLAAAVVGLALIWLLLLEPALDTTKRLRSSLPPLRAQAARVDVVIQEAQALKQSVGRPAAMSGDMPAAIAQSLERAGLTPTATVAATEDDTVWLVTLEHAPVEGMLQWLHGLPFELRLQPIHAQLERASGADGRMLPGLVSGEVQLAAATQESE